MGNMLDGLGGGGGGHELQSDGVDLPIRSRLNFTGGAVTDDEENDTTNVPIGDAATIQGTAVSAIATLHGEILRNVAGMWTPRPGVPRENGAARRAARRRRLSGQWVTCPALTVDGGLGHEIVGADIAQTGERYGVVFSSDDGYLRYMPATGLAASNFDNTEVLAQPAEEGDLRAVGRVFVFGSLVIVVGSGVLTYDLETDTRHDYTREDEGNVGDGMAVLAKGYIYITSPGSGLYSVQRGAVDGFLTPVFVDTDVELCGIVIDDDGYLWASGGSTYRWQVNSDGSLTATTIDVGGPHGSNLVWDGRRIWGLRGPTIVGPISVMEEDSATEQVIAIPGSSIYHGIQLLFDGELVWVGSHGSQGIMAIDPSTLETVLHWQSLSSLAVSPLASFGPDGPLLYLDQYVLRAIMRTGQAAVDFTTRSFCLTAADSPYTMLPQDATLEVDSTDGVVHIDAVYVEVGHTLTIIDASGTAATHNIQFDWGGSSIVLSSNGARAVLRRSSTDWKIISTIGTVA